MHFEIEHVFDAPIGTVEAAMFHPGYFAFLAARHDAVTDLEPQAVEEDARCIKRRVRYQPKPVFDQIGPKRVPAQWFEFVEESTWDKQERRLVFDNVPCTEKVKRRFTNHGEITLEEVAPGKTKRRARAELKLHGLPFVLRALAPFAEQMIAREAKKLLETEARVLNEFIASDTLRDSIRPQASP